MTPLGEIVPLDGSNDDGQNLAATPTPVQGRRSGVSGRLAFADDICSMHPGTLEMPCAKFGHLPGEGRGIYQPGIWKQFLVIIRVVLKPMLYMLLVFLAGSLLLGWVNGVLRSNGGLQSPIGGVSGVNRPTPHSSISPDKPGSNSSPTGSPSSPTNIPTVTVTAKPKAKK